MLTIGRFDPQYGFLYTLQEEGSLCPYCKSRFSHIAVVDKTIKTHNKVDGKTRVYCTYCKKEMDYLEVIRYTVLRN